MVRSLAPRLLLDVSHNQKYSERFGFFEIGKIYAKEGKGSSYEEALLATIEKKPYPEKKILAGIAVGYTIEEVRTSLE